MHAPGVGTWIERRARRSPGAVALLTVEGRRTYGDLAARIRAFAAELTTRGVTAGDRVAYHGGNDPVALVSLFAAAAIGAVWVPIHPARREDEVRAILDDASPSLLVRGEPETHPDADLPELEASEMDTLPAAATLPAREVEPDDLVLLPYTSGTTGAPKGVLLSEGSVLWHAAQMVAALGLSATDVSLAAAPFTRMGGVGVSVLPTFFAGGTVAVPRVVDGPAVLETIARDRVTVAFANPDLLDRMMQASGWHDADLSPVRTGVVGGGLVPEALLRTYLDRGVRLRHGYGLTEAGPVVSLLDDAEAAERPTSVGRALPFIEVRTVRPDGSACDPGEVGEWQIRGPTVCAGYWGLPRTHDDGWFPTGDLGSIDAGGYLTFLDRASSALRIGDATVYPATVEGLLYGLPGVADAAVAEVGGRLIAAIVPEPGTLVDGAAVLASLARRLPAASVPSEIRTVAWIPRNAAVKVRRDELSDILRR
jgi:fatty-acyl-CoA synthase